MQTELLESAEKTGIATFNEHEFVVARLKQKYAGFKMAADNSNYEEVKGAVAELRKTRGEIEKRRVELKADALAWGRKVDGDAKLLTAAIAEIEDPLHAQKKAVDDAAAEAAWQKANAERIEREAEELAKRQAAEAKARMERRQEEAKLKVEREALAAERKAQQAERDRWEAEKEQALVQQQAAQAKIDAEQRAITAERDRLEREQQARLAKERAEQEAVEKAARDREEAEAAAKAKERADRAEAARLEALRPDGEKLSAMAAVLRGLEWPEVELDVASQAIANSRRDVLAVADYLADWRG